MDAFNNAQVRANSNPLPAAGQEFYREASFESLCSKLEFKTITSCISRVHMNDANAIIKNNSLNDDLIVVTDGPAYNCEICVDSEIEVVEEQITMDMSKSIMFRDCEWTRYYSDIDYMSEVQRKTNYKLALSIDEYVMTTAVAAATVLTTVVDPADCATGEAALCEAKNIYAGMMTDGGEMCAIIPSSLACCFNSIISTRETVLGDQALTSGNFYDIQGWKLVFVNDASPAGVALGGKVLFAVDRPVDLYMDEAGFAEGMRDQQGSTPDCVNFNKLYYKQVNLKAHVWDCNTEKLTISA